MYQLADCFYIKFRNDAVAFRMPGQLFCSDKYFPDQPLSDFRNLQSGIPGKNFLKIAYRGFGEFD